MKSASEKNFNDWLQDNSYSLKIHNRYQAVARDAWSYCSALESEKSSKLANALKQIDELLGKRKNLTAIEAQCYLIAGAALKEHLEQ